MMDYSGAYIHQRMWEVSPENLDAAMRSAGLNQSQLAERVGVKQPSIGRLLTGETKTTRSLERIAQVLGTTPAYLRGETDDPGKGRQIAPKPTAEDPDEVEIDSLDLAYGMGGTFVDLEDGEIAKAKFSRAWLRKFTEAPPSLLFSADGVGDSMWPTIHDRDTVIGDRSHRTVDQGDKIWAIVYGGVGMIKRLRPLPDGTVRIMSDNPQVSDELAADGDLFIVGRVAAIVRRV